MSLYPTTHCPFTSAWVDAIYGSEFHRTDGGGDMLYTGPLYTGPHREERRRMVLTYIPHKRAIYGTTTNGKYEPRMGTCRICGLPGGDCPAED